MNVNDAPHSPQHCSQSIQDKVNRARERATKMLNKKIKKIKREYFQSIENPNKAPVLAVWECRLCVYVCVCFIPEKEAAVRRSRNAAPSDSTFTFSLLADSSSATLSLTVCCCCHRAPLILSANATAHRFRSSLSK